MIAATENDCGNVVNRQEEKKKHNYPAYIRVIKESVTIVKNHL